MICGKFSLLTFGESAKQVTIASASSPLTARDVERCLGLSLFSHSLAFSSRSLAASSLPSVAYSNACATDKQCIGTPGIPSILNTDCENEMQQKADLHLRFVGEVKYKTAPEDAAVKNQRTRSVKSHVLNTAKNSVTFRTVFATLHAVLRGFRDLP